MRIQLLTDQAEIAQHRRVRTQREILGAVHPCAEYVGSFNVCNTLAKGMGDGN
jgi:hypothetical protein